MHPELQHDPIHGQWPTWKVIQIQGKQDEEPIPEYRQRINEYMTYLREKEGVGVEWHPTEAIRPGGEEEDYISEIGEAINYMQEYLDGNHNAHDYPSVSVQRGDDPHDDYGLPKHGFDGGLYVPKDGIETLVSQGIDTFTDNDNRQRRYYYADYSPDEAARAILFLTEQLKIQGGFDWDGALQQAIQEGWQKIDKERDKHLENNWDWEHEVMSDSWGQIVEDEPDAGHDPDEIDYEHPDMEWAQNYVSDQLSGPWKEAIDFLQDLQKGTTVQQHPDNIKLPGEPGAVPHDVQQQMDADPDISLKTPGALSRWNIITTTQT
jgi:hypothetical protein